MLFHDVLICLYSPNSLLLGFYLRKKELATLTGRAPELCGWALCPGLVLLLSFVAGLCGWALSSSCPCLGSTPELWALCPGLVLLLSLSWPRP